MPDVTLPAAAPGGAPRAAQPVQAMTPMEQAAAEVEALEVEAAQARKKSPFGLGARIASGKVGAAKARLDALKAGEERRAKTAARAPLVERAVPVLQAEAQRRGVDPKEAENDIALWVNSDSLDPNEVTKTWDTRANRDRTGDRADAGLALRQEQFTESKRRFDAMRSDRANRQKDGGALDPRKVGEFVDRELSIFNTKPDALASMLSDEEIRAALDSKTLGPGGRTVVEGIAKQRGVTLIPADAGFGPPPPAGSSANVPVPPSAAPSIGSALAVEREEWEIGPDGNPRRVK